MTTWLECAIGRYGNPRIEPKGWTSLHSCRRKAWVWFPGGENYNVCIDDFGGHVETEVGRPGFRVKVNSLSLISDVEMKALLDIAWERNGHE